MLKLSVAGLMIRLYLMMAVVILAGFTGLWYLALLALPIFLSCLMGVQFTKYHSIKKPGLQQRDIVDSGQHHPAH